MKLIEAISKNPRNFAETIGDSGIFVIRQLSVKLLKNYELYASTRKDHWDYDVHTHRLLPEAFLIDIPLSPAELLAKADGLLLADHQNHQQYSGNGTAIRE